MPVPGWELTICGLAELGEHGARDVTHVLSIIDPDHPDPTDFAGYGRRHHRLTLGSTTSSRPAGLGAAGADARRGADPLRRGPRRAPRRAGSGIS
jgi:hypothetical protein